MIEPADGGQERVGGHHAVARPVLNLARWPNVAIASIVEDGESLAADDSELDSATGELWRLDGTDRRVAWPAAKIVVAYAAGYRLPGDPQRDLPEDFERACLETVKARWFARLRDPLIKGEQVQGIASADFWVPSTGDGDPGLPPGVVGLLQRYRLPIV